MDGLEKPLSVFTTRPDTVFGVTYMSVAPEHPALEALTTPEQKQAVEDYVTAVSPMPCLQSRIARHPKALGCSALRLRALG